MSTSLMSPGRSSATWPCRRMTPALVSALHTRCASSSVPPPLRLRGRMGRGQCGPAAMQRACRKNTAFGKWHDIGSLHEQTRRNHPPATSRRPCSPRPPACPPRRRPRRTPVTALCYQLHKWQARVLLPQLLQPRLELLGLRSLRASGRAPPQYHLSAWHTLRVRSGGGCTFAHLQQRLSCGEGRLGSGAGAPKVL